MPNFHSWYKGEQEQIGTYIFRDDVCNCGCIRRTVLNDADKEEIESYTINDDVFLQEPPCTKKRYKSRTKHINNGRKQNTGSKRTKKDTSKLKNTRREG